MQHHCFSGFQAQLAVLSTDCSNKQSESAYFTPGNSIFDQQLTFSHFITYLILDLQELFFFVTFTWLTYRSADLIIDLSTFIVMKQ